VTGFQTCALPICHENQFFVFLLNTLKRIGPSASVLFKGIQLAKLNATQLLVLLDDPAFIWAYVAQDIENANNAIGKEIENIRVAMNRV
jgi:hypothetical protein